VQCPCLDIGRAQHFWKESYVDTSRACCLIVAAVQALAAAHAKGMYVQLTQFSAIIDTILVIPSISIVSIMM
jgi:hypothetical protein